MAQGGNFNIPAHRVIGQDDRVFAQGRRLVDVRHAGAEACAVADGLHHLVLRLAHDEGESAPHFGARARSDSAGRNSLRRPTSRRWEC